jgi:hypothetical protein
MLVKLPIAHCELDSTVQEWFRLVAAIDLLSIEFVKMGVELMVVLVVSLVEVALLIAVVKIVVVAVDSVMLEQSEHGEISFASSEQPNVALLPSSECSLAVTEQSPIVFAD